MNKKTLFMATMTATLISFSSILPLTEAEELRAQLGQPGLSRTERDLLIIRLLGLPRNSHETPETPKVMRHDKDQTRGGDIKGRAKNIENARIFFSTDETGKPCYRPIHEHLRNNPDFGTIKLIIYHAGLFSDSFEHIGIVGDETAREKFIESMTDQQGGILFRLKNGLFARAEKDGVWCPARNNQNKEPFFVGGINDISICNRYAEFVKEQEEFQAKKFKK